MIIVSQMSVLHGFCERLLPGSIVITTTRKLPPLNPKPAKVKGKGKMKGKLAAAARAQQRQQLRDRPGVRCRLVLHTSTSLAYAQNTLSFGERLVPR